MKKILGFLVMMFMCLVAYGQTYNIVQTSYINTTIAQTVVFNSAMQSGGTFTFTVQAHNGGGNANTNDTANVKILFYNSSNTLLATASTNYSGNLPIPTGYHGVDPAVPWTTLSISSTNCGGSCANVAYAKVQMVGIDGAYWAGDYGPYYKEPSFTFNGGPNILYNPEFGTAPDGTFVQGWTSSAGWGACQGAYGGSNACSTNYSGVTANMSNGGYSATGGTTSGTAGGYVAAPAPNPTNIYTTSTSTVYITHIWPTSYNSPGGEGATNAFDNNPYTKYLNFDKYNAGVTVRLSQGRVVSGFTITTANDFPGRDPTSYKLYGSNDGVNWTLIQEGTLSLSDSRYTTSGVIGVTNSNAYFYYYMQFPTTKAGDGCGLDCDSMQIAEITYIYDTNNTTTSTDQGGGGSSSPVDPVQAAATPTVVSTSTSNSVSTSSSSSSTNSVSVSRPTTTGNYTDVFVGTTTTTTTTTTPVTTTTWSDGSTTTSNGTSTSTSSTTYTITSTTGTAPTYSRTAPNTNGNSIYVKQVYAGSNTSVRLEQDGNNNAITGTTSGWATVDGNNSAIDVRQFGQGNIVGLKMNAWGNNINIRQQTAAGGDVSNNILNFESAGNGNAVTAQQQTNTNTASIKTTWDINTVNLTQKGGTGNTSYITVTGYWNTVNNTQNGNNNFTLVNISGDNNSATVNQTGNDHSTLLNLIGNKNSVSVVQTGVGDTYSLQQTCTNPSGCSVSVIRNR